MACSLKVLINIRVELEKRLIHENEINSLKTPEGKEKHKEVLREIYDRACEEIIMEGGPDGILRGKVDYIKDKALSFEDAEESEGRGFGATKPEEIRSAILSWNHNQSRHLIRLLENFEELADKRRFRKLSELFAASMRKTGHIPTDQFRYPASIYELRKALDAVDNVFTYGQNKIFYDGYTARPYVPTDVIYEAREYPENFLILEVYYD